MCHQSDICTTEKEGQVDIMKNEIRFTLEPKQRPKLAQEIGKILGTVPHYERVPSCAYDIAGYRLDKEGVLHTPEGAEAETVENLIRQLRECGFQDDAEFTEEVQMQQDKLTIAVPRASLTDTALENLRKIIVNKQTLLQRAFQTDSTEVEITEKKINFAWFPYTEDGDEITAYTQFITRLYDMAKSGMNPKTLQYLMGHSDISVTMNVYTHIGFGDAEEELKRMEEFRKAQAEVEQKKEKPMSQKMFKVV